MEPESSPANSTGKTARMVEVQFADLTGEALLRAMLQQRAR
jgi:hypothetical protein